jgi:hypothetical protein
MRFKVFVSLLVIALSLDIALLGFSLVNPGARLFELPAAIAAAPTESQATASPPPSLRQASTAPTATSTPTTPTLAPTPTSTPSPSPTASPSPIAAATTTVTVTATPASPPRLIAAKSVSFTPADKAVRANIRLALAHYYGALTHVVLQPGAVFSFNSTLGLRPQRLPWKNVKVQPTLAPEPPAPASSTPIAPAPEPEAQLVQGGGLCDLASRFVMAARPMLPARAFHFVNHVTSNGIHLSGVPVRDSVSIWAIGGGRGEQDLTITNLTEDWLEFVVDRDGEKITISARLWNRSPPGW